MTKRKRNGLIALLSILVFGSLQLDLVETPELVKLLGQGASALAGAGFGLNWALERLRDSATEDEDETVKRG